jgi:predicted outer membrane protein
VSGKGLQHPNMTYEEYERYYSDKDRAKMPDSDFAGPHSSFPVRTQQDVFNAARLVGHADDPAAVKAAIIRIAKRKRFKLPDAWQEEEKPTEAAVSTPFKPKDRIARLKVRWIGDDAISLNGRKYPREAVDTLIRSAQLQLSDPNALPMTCYLSHDKADQDSTLDLTGKVSDVWREGNEGWAYIDVPDTRAGRETATLASGGYMRAISLRASGAEMRMDKESAFPLVGGSHLKLEGIDLTTSPGLSQVARITDVVLESHTPQNLQEVFNANPTSLILEQEKSMEIKEEGIDPQVSGVTQGMDGNPTSDYAQRQYPVPAVHDAGEADIDQQVHDHIAGAMSLQCSGMSSAESQALRNQMKEAGAKFNKSAKAHLMAAHDAVAKKTGVQCSTNGTGKMASDGMQDGDDDDGGDNNESGVQSLINALREALPVPQPAKVEQPAKAVKEKSMNPEELAKLLQEAGYTVQAPLTEEQKLQAKLEAMQADFDKKLAEQLASAQTAQLEAFKKALTESKAPPPQRKTLVEGAAEQVSRHYYRNGDYLREKIQSLDFERLIDRSAPIPEGIDPERLLRELYTATVSLTPDEWNRGKMFQG